MSESAHRPSLERDIAQLGGELLAAARQHEPRPSLTDRMMNWAMADPAFKVNLFRFVDVFPSLTNADQVHQHVEEYLDHPGATLPAGLRLAIKAGGFAKWALRRTVEDQIHAMAKRFIVGEDERDAIDRLHHRWNRGLAFSVDLLGEACLTEHEAANYRRRYRQAVDVLAEGVKKWKHQPALEADHLGPIPRANVSVKITAFAAKVDPLDFERSVDALQEMLTPLLEAAGRLGVFVNFDMEHHALKDLTLELFMRCCAKVDFHAGIAMQAYLRSGIDDAWRIIRFAQQHDRLLTVRLVKGAYWDQEVLEAEQRGWPVPVWVDKDATDANFERMTDLLLHATPRDPGRGGIRLAVGSHNARSIAHAMAKVRQIDLPDQAVEFQMLYGMAEGLKRGMVDRGLRVREYMPVGELAPGMAYLVRRLLENTSNESWLQAGFHRDVSDGELLRTPMPLLTPTPTPGPVSSELNKSGNTGNSDKADKPAASGQLDDVLDADDAADVQVRAQRHALSPNDAVVGDGHAFFNEPLRDFGDASQREQFAAAIQRVNDGDGDGNVWPDAPADVSVGDAAAMVGVATEAAPGWAAKSVIERASCLTRAAALMREHRDELAAVILRESGKPWRHADGDVCEAIDFCEFYARQAAALCRPRRLGRFDGEYNLHRVRPRGVAAVISPWNFPLAIACGMTTAAIVTGNPVILKPAEQSPRIAARMCEMLWQAGVPADVLQLAPGPGETIGAGLVRDPRVAMIAFTGSKAVGLNILQAASEVGPTQGHVKHVVCEMGGKNAIIIDDSADLDQAVPAVIESAFGYAGQRCSACSRVIVLAGVHDAFVKRLVEATRACVIGDPALPRTDVGPLIDIAAAEHVRRYIDIGIGEGQLALAMTPPADLPADLRERTVGPHIVTDIGPNDRLATEEIFGPVLAVLRADTFDEALSIANSVDYRLTGGVFSRTPSRLDRARDGFHVGNLYLNRSTVGAQVGRQPFGGFGLSGGGTQAGGEDYLRHFVLPQTICENTTRRGYAPELDEDLS